LKFLVFDTSFIPLSSIVVL